jgi:SAM-dependent methyltransferase
MATPDDAKARAAATYNAAADFYDDPANSFWDRFGRKTIERLRLLLGARVFDACCGAGASAIPAAERVGTQGSVLGINLAQNLLKLARAKASARRLKNIEFRLGDVLDPAVPESQFDAVVCVFGIFFIPDMPSAVRYKGFNPWDRISDPPSVRALLHAGGVDQVEVIAEAGTHPIQSPQAWWSAVLGSGYRATLEQLDATARERVRIANLDFIRESGLRSVEANVVYAVATKA